MLITVVIVIMLAIITRITIVIIRAIITRIRARKDDVHSSRDASLWLAVLRVWSLGFETSMGRTTLLKIKARVGYGLPYFYSGVSR